MATVICQCFHVYDVQAVGAGRERHPLVMFEGKAITKCPHCEDDLHKLWWEQELATWNKIAQGGPTCTVAK